MKQLYVCDKCGKQFEDYDDCYRHESEHFDVPCFGFDSQMVKLYKWDEKQAPASIAVVFGSYDYESQKEVHQVYEYKRHRLLEDASDEIQCEYEERIAEYCKKNKETKDDTEVNDGKH